MTSGLGPAVRILAGAPAEGHTRIARPGSADRWFEPMHVRQPARVREDMAGQVVAGATILVAPTWLTHRRALVPVGETRRVQEWTSLAVALAREASDIGEERRGQGPAISIVGVLPDPDAHDEEATGRLLKPDAAAERDERAQAGVLAETGIDVVVIESRPSLDRARVAVRAVIEHGVDAWIVIPGSRADGLPLGAWLDALAADGVGMLLFETLDGAPDERPPEGPFGLLLPHPADVLDPGNAATTWIERGASVVGIATDANPETLRPLVEARDAAAAAAARSAAQEHAELDEWVADAARRATGGRALWIGNPPTSLPSGFEWTVVAANAIGTLPSGTWRLSMSTADLDPREGARLVERGGIVAGATGDPDALIPLARAAGLRLDHVAQATTGEWRYLARRED